MGLTLKDNHNGLVIKLGQNGRPHCAGADEPLGTPRWRLVGWWNYLL